MLFSFVCGERVILKEESIYAILWNRYWEKAAVGPCSLIFCHFLCINWNLSHHWLTHFSMPTKRIFFSFLKCYHLTIHKAHQRGTKVKVKDVMRHHANSKPWSVYWRRKLKWCLWWLLTYNSYARTRRDSCFVFIYCPGLICIFMVNAFMLYWVMCLYTFFT